MSETRETKRAPCPDCPDGQLWTSKGPTDDPCPTCNGDAFVFLPASVDEEGAG